MTLGVNGRRMELCKKQRVADPLIAPTMENTRLDIRMLSVPNMGKLWSAIGVGTR